MKQPITRFAPSPTGYLHIGGLRTALYAYLVAKKSGGKFLLRIEDTDRERFVADGTENILNSLYWANIIPDEGVRLKDSEISQEGAAGPYIQSERLSIYRTYVDQLVSQGHAYPCFCTSERLEQVREERQVQKLPPGYDGHCAGLSSEDTAQRIAAGERHVIRLRMPESGEISFTDIIRGEVTFKASDVDDQVLLKSDGFPTYHLAVVVDDHLMNITHVIRGEEWISSTPKHLQLYTYFGWEPPLFAHLPLLLNSDKSKLSKRQGDVSVQDYITKGYLKEALINFVAFLGWNPGDERELFTLRELEQVFSLEKVNKAGAVFNIEKLDWYNREYIKKMTDDELARYLDTYMPTEAKTYSAYSIMLPKIARIIGERINKGSDIETLYKTDIEYYFLRPTSYDTVALLWKDLRNTEDGKTKTKEHLTYIKNAFEAYTGEWNKESLKELIWKYAEEQGKGFVLWPLRYALSGQEKSPDPFALAEILEKEEVCERISNAYNQL